MPKHIIAAVAILLCAIYFAQSVAAQYDYGYDLHHHDGYRHDSHGHGYLYGDPRYHDYGSHAHYQDNYHYGHGGLDVCCPARGQCPLQYQPHSVIGSPYSGDRLYQSLPFQNAPVYEDPNLGPLHDHAGHDHGNHSHDGSSHEGESPGSARAPSDRGYLAPPSLPPDSVNGFQPQPNFRRGQPQRDDSIRMDTPPPSSFGTSPPNPPESNRPKRFDTPPPATL